MPKIFLFVVFVFHAFLIEFLVEYFSFFYFVISRIKIRATQKLDQPTDSEGWRIRYK